jgi:hypothetical protein
MLGEWREPNLITKLLPNSLEQKLQIDDALEYIDAVIEDAWEEGTEKIKEFSKKVDKVITENTTEFIEEVKEIK